jgi:PPOX class probable FMN-dependent enzyme
MYDVFGQQVDKHLRSSSDLRDIVPVPSHWVDNKVIDHVDDLAQRFIAAASLAIVSTSRANGVLDITPRGDPPGFVKVLNKALIAIPDRPGNRRMDTFENVFANPNVGILFIIPGHRDTLRVSGKGAVVQDARLRQVLAVNGRPSELILLVHVQRVMCHCPKAFIRGKVWQKDEWPDTSNVPTLAEMLVAHGEMSETLEEVEAGVKKDREIRLY